MLYRFIISRYIDALAYVSASATAVWLVMSRQYDVILPGCPVPVSPLYGLVIAAFCGALLMGKHICLEGGERSLDRVTQENKRLEERLIQQNQSLAAREASLRTLADENGLLRNRISALEENSPSTQLSELRKKLRGSEEEKRSALTLLARNLREQLDTLQHLSDSQLAFASEVLRKEVVLLENEIKRGEISFYELCLKIIEIRENLAELKEIFTASVVDHSAKPESVTDAWLNFIKVNGQSDPATVARSFKFFKMAFHPDRFTSESLKVEATRYFQHSINAHNAVKRRKTQSHE